MTNPFILKEARRKVAGIQVNDRVRVKWSYTQAYGSGTKTHIGRVLGLDDWLTCTGSNQTPGTLRMPITMIDEITVVPSDESAEMAG